MNKPLSPLHNGLLCELPPVELERLLPFLEQVEMPVGAVLYEPGSKLSHSYFPATSVVSLMYVMEDGASAEIAVIGNEGLIGLALMMGGDTTSHSAVVQTAGYGYRLRAHFLRQECSRNGPLLCVLLKFMQSMITQMAQTSVCYRHHSLDQQLCRWLLFRLDRLPNGELTMSQELIATMLGVRRETVTVAAGKLQAAGLIEYHRGHIQILDRHGLEARACECYQVVKSESDRLLPNPLRTRGAVTQRLASIKMTEPPYHKGHLSAQTQRPSDMRT